MKKALLLSLMALVVCVSSISFADQIANHAPLATTNQWKGWGWGSANSIWIDPEYPQGGNVTYNLDGIDLKGYITNTKQSIMKVKCDGKEILKSLGITNGKVISVGIQEGDFIYNYDFNNCSFYSNRTTYLLPTDEIKDADAIKMAQDFVNKAGALDYFRKMLGSPIITYRNNYDAAGVMREGKSYSASVVFPIKVGGRTVYQAYGEPLGLYVEVNSKGVNSVSAQILPFSFLKADSSKLSADDMIAFLKKGGNQPYYTYNMWVDFKAEVKAMSYEKVWIFTQKYPPYGGSPALYLTSGIRIKTDKQIDNGPGQDKKDYNMVVSDYKIGNNQGMYYY